MRRTRGLIDENLIDDVGCALCLRCRPIPRAGKNGRADSPAERLLCTGCGRYTAWGQYRQTSQGRQLYAAGGFEAFRTFLTRFDQARSAREKLFAIDRLIHAFHYNLTAGAKVPTASRPAVADVIRRQPGGSDRLPGPLEPR